ncbi:DoxX family membrane protein [Chryseobacterium oryctis]|uniref:DoxX family protein n=1 Tax=Chryseobacterium oryctis TaxID=2952618 RepID=A0ABT3HPI2_9FLAO|nr:DoxX family protein [Chryseobacterium oryctis]MCW3161690.1 DoxX family protein [Chryseobacterium oryctis]
MKIFKTIVFVIFALMFINAGLDKFLHYMPVPPLPPELQKVNESIMSLKWLLPLVGFVELFGGLLTLLPKTRILGGLMIFPVMIGILCHNITFMPEGLAIAGVFFLVNIWILVDNRHKISLLFQ